MLAPLHRVPHPLLSVQVISGLMLLLTGALGVQHHPAPAQTMVLEQVVHMWG